MNNISALEAREIASEFNEKEITTCIEDMLEIIFERISSAAKHGTSTILFKHNFVGIMEHNVLPIYFRLKQILLDHNYSIKAREKCDGSNLWDICWDISWI